LARFLSLVNQWLHYMFICIFVLVGYVIQLLLSWLQSYILRSCYPLPNPSWDLVYCYYLEHNNFRNKI
jgi:hypothetical protein